MLVAAYNLLKVTPPFRRWKLPLADEVEFHVRKFEHCADCVWGGENYIIRVSEKRHGRLALLVETLAHEMCHIKQHFDAPRERDHGRRWRQLADQVCRQHGFDRKTF